MGYVTIEDYEGSAEIVVFPSVWETARPILQENTAVAVNGHVQANERDVRILADSIVPMSSLEKRAKSVKEVHLYIDDFHSTRQISDELAGVLKRFHGRTPVILHMEGSRQKIEMDEEFYLDATAEAETALKALLGARSVEIR